MRLLADLSTAALLAEVNNTHGNRILSVAFSPDGSKVVSGSSDKSIKLWGVLAQHTQAAVVEYGVAAHGVVGGCDVALACVWQMAQLGHCWRRWPMRTAT